MKKLVLQLLVVFAFIGTQVQAMSTFIDFAGPLYISNASLSNCTSLNDSNPTTTFNLPDAVYLSLSPLTHQTTVYSYSKLYGAKYTTTTVFGGTGAYLQVGFATPGSIVVNEYDANNSIASSYSFNYTGSTPPQLYIYPSSTVSKLKISNIALN